MIKATNISPVPEKFGDNKPNKNHPVSANQDRVVKELPKSLTLYVPENLDIDSIIRENPPNFSYHRDKFLYIIHLITDIPSRNKDKEYVFIPINS